MRRFLRNNGLSIVLLMAFLATVSMAVLAGFGHYNAEQEEHGQPAVGLGEYLVSSHLWEAITENMESEFLQMGAYVLLTAYLFQKGSAESKDPDKPHQAEVDEDPRDYRDDPNAPWPVRQGGLWLWVYSYSLTGALFLLFVAFFVGHLVSGAREFSAEQAEHGQPGVTAAQYLLEPRFWFESMQNWQSEFFSILAMVLLSVVLRQYGSPESKPVHMGHGENPE